MTGVSVDVKSGKVTTFTVEAVVIPIEVKQQEARNNRDNALKECDWTQVADVTLVNAVEWLAYRQALRDVTLDNGWGINPVAAVKAIAESAPA